MCSKAKELPVEKEYEKNPDISREDIKKFREWLKTQPHLPEEYITDLDLVLIYFCCEKSAEVSKQILDLNYTYRTHLDIIFKDRVVDKTIINCLHGTLIAPLPTPTVNGYRAVYFRLLNADPKRYMFTELNRTFMMMFDLWQSPESTLSCCSRLVLLIDMDLTCVAHLGKIDLMVMKHMIFFLTEALFVKLKEVHFLNAPNFMEKLMMMIRPFVDKTILDIVRIHERGSDTLDKYVKKETLPKESGGNYKDIITLRDDLIRRLKENDDYFKQESRKRVNESLRTTGKKVVDDIFGIQGSFKKLDID